MLSLEPYKGVRDFYPQAYRIQRYIFDTWKHVVEQFGYDEYQASVLEPSELYEAKSGEEIINNETYTFTDRGGRRVTLRPEMTPTVARMIAQKRRELTFPLRWYSIPNLFRYERPQRGRLREHWQLNVDLFGDSSIYGTAELIEIGYKILTSFGLMPHDFTIKVNDRALLNEWFLQEGIEGESAYKLQKLIDKKNKINDFEEQVINLIGRSIDFSLQENILISSLKTVLQERGITNIEFSPELMRGFDYYTGIVFEFFDNHPENKRSLFGGGQYDHLLDIFGVERIQAVGFGAGDVGIANVLDTYNLLPSQFKKKISIGLCLVDESASKNIVEISKMLRDSGIVVAVNTSMKAVKHLIEWSQKNEYDYTILIGEREKTEQIYTIRNNITKETLSVPREEVINTVYNSKNIST